MGTNRMLEQLLGDAGRNPGEGGGGLDALLEGLSAARAPERLGGAESPPSGEGDGLGDLLGSLTGGRGGGSLVEWLEAITGARGDAASGGGLDELPGGRGGASGADNAGGLDDLLSGPLGAAAAGGLLGMLLGGRRGGGRLMRVGGMAMLGLLAHRAYEQWKAQHADAAGAGAATPAPGEFARAGAPDGYGKPFGLSLVRAMVAAARADGQLDAREHERIFEAAEKLDLSPAEKGEMFGILQTEPDPAMIAALASTEAQKAELYLASAMITGADTASERVYLAALAHHLGLAPGLRATLDAQVREAAELGA
jgi:uncharacterized membrane protein YebE (DUF533 family)